MILNKMALEDCMMESLLFLNGQNLEIFYRIVVDMKHHFYYHYHYIGTTWYLCWETRIMDLNSYLKTTIIPKKLYRWHSTWKFMMAASTYYNRMWLLLALKKEARITFLMANCDSMDEYFHGFLFRGWACRPNNLNQRQLVKLLMSRVSCLL